MKEPRRIKVTEVTTGLFRGNQIRFDFPSVTEPSAIKYIGEHIQDEVRKVSKKQWDVTFVQRNNLCFYVPLQEIYRHVDRNVMRWVTKAVNNLMKEYIKIFGE